MGIGDWEIQKLLKMIIKLKLYLSLIKNENLNNSFQWVNYDKIKSYINNAKYGETLNKNKNSLIIEKNDEIKEIDLDQNYNDELNMKTDANEDLSPENILFDNNLEEFIGFFKDFKVDPKDEISYNRDTSSIQNVNIGSKNNNDFFNLS